MLNSVNLIGRAASTPSMRYVGPKELACCEFTIAIDNPHAKPDENGRKQGFFFGVTTWGKTAEVLHGHLVKGQKIGISGRLSQEEFIPKGKTESVQKTRIVCTDFDLGSKPASQHAP